MAESHTMKVYGLGEPVENICLKSGRICIIEGKIVRPLVKERTYQAQLMPSKEYPGYSALGMDTALFIDLDPRGRHDIRRLVPK